MKKILFPLIVLVVSLLKINAQNSNSSNSSPNDKNAFSVQILKHALGVDYERTIYKNFGLAISGGLAGAEIEVKFHLKPQINSPSIGFATGYTWMHSDLVMFENQDTHNGEAFRINMFFFEYRTPKHLVFTAGLGWFDYVGDTRIRARGGIGYYLPW